jgi:hypothetical protein
VSALELERKMLKLFKKQLRQTQTRLKRLKLNIAYSEKLILALRRQHGRDSNLRNG